MESRLEMMDETQGRQQLYLLSTDLKPWSKVKHFGARNSIGHPSPEINSDAVIHTNQFSRIKVHNAPLELKTWVSTADA